MQPALVEITFAIARKLLGLDELRPDSSSRPQQHPVHNAFTTSLRASDAREDTQVPIGGQITSSRPLLRQSIDLAGTYHDVGYGSIELRSSSSQSDACWHVLHDFDLIDEATQPSMTHEDALFASWPSVFTTHARFVPVDEDLTSTAGRRYFVDFGTLYPTGYGRNTTPFAHWIFKVIADFIVEDGQVKGFGLSGIGERQGYGSVEGDSDVWFTKCESRRLSGLLAADLAQEQALQARFRLISQMVILRPNIGITATFLLYTIFLPTFIQTHVYLN
jgi:hypothetical protein